MQIQANLLPIYDPLAWEAALASAEEYWFQLSEATRRQFVGRTVALSRDHILDSDQNVKALRQRLMALYWDQPVLYLDADAEQEQPLFVRSPRWG